MLRLRPYKSTDAAEIAAWITSETEFYKWSAGKIKHFPVLPSELDLYYNNGEETKDIWGMTAVDEEGIAGHLFMKFLDEEKTQIRFGLIVLNPSRRGRGYGKEMVSLALKYAFEILKAEKVTLGVFENNPAAYHCYLASGLRDTQEAVLYHFQGEEWRCLELEANKSVDILAGS